MAQPMLRVHCGMVGRLIVANHFTASFRRSVLRAGVVVQPVLGMHGRMVGGLVLRRRCRSCANGSDAKGHREEHDFIHC